MSTFIKLYNGETLPVFNIRNYSPAVKLTSVQADSIVSTNITSNSVTSSAYSQSNNSGTQDPVATQLYCDGKVTALKNDLLGGASSAYDTLKEIQTALEGDDNVISGLLSTVSGKANQSDVTNLTNALNDAITADTQKFLIHDDNFSTIETHLSTLDVSMNTLTNRLTTGEQHLGVLDSSMNSVQTSIKFVVIFFWDNHN